MVTFPILAGKHFGHFARIRAEREDNTSRFGSALAKGSSCLLYRLGANAARLAMTDRHDVFPRGCSRRRALWLGIISGVVWAVGTGLTTGELIRYFAIDLGATGFEFGLILALPALAGLLRLVAPAVIRWTGSSKAACLIAHASSST